MGTEWVQLVSTVGFPIVACAALFYWINSTMKELSATITKNTEAINHLVILFEKGDKN